MTRLERRKHPRFAGHFRVDLLNMGDDPAIPVSEPIVIAEALDVSLHGLRLVSYYNVPVGSTLSVVIYYQGQGSVCLCEVVWRRDMDAKTRHYGLYIKNWGRLDPLLERKLNEIEAQTFVPNDAALAFAF